MGWAMVMEGLMSTAYHVCPTTVNFQFDTTFMYLMAMLMTISLYHERSPGTKHPYTAVKLYLGHGLILIFEALSLYVDKTLFWASFCSIYLSLIVYSVVEAYWRNVAKYNHSTMLISTWSLFSRFKMPGSSDSTDSSFRKRDFSFAASLLITAIIAAFNLVLCWLFFTHVEASSASNHILVVLFGNLILYAGYYLVMKLLSGERPGGQCWFYAVACQARTILVLCILDES